MKRQHWRIVASTGIPAAFLGAYFLFGFNGALGLFLLTFVGVAVYTCPIWDSRK